MEWPPCKVRGLKISALAEVAELVDALASGASGLWPRSEERRVGKECRL